MTIQSKSYRYMWAIVPSPDLVLKIHAIRQEFSQNFSAVKALRPPVHLTLYTPFEMPGDVVEDRIDKAGTLLGTIAPFSLELKNYGFFENGKSPVVFIDVVPDISLKYLNAELSHETRKLFALDANKNAFHPHFTIGYRDISPEIFPAVKQAYSRRAFNAKFDVETVCLFRHSGTNWELQHEFPLGKNAVAQGTLF